MLQFQACGLLTLQFPGIEPRLFRPPVCFHFAKHRHIDWSSILCFFLSVFNNVQAYRVSSVVVIAVTLWINQNHVNRLLRNNMIAFLFIGDFKIPLKIGRGCPVENLTLKVGSCDRFLWTRRFVNILVYRCGCWLSFGHSTCLFVHHTLCLNSGCFGVIPECVCLTEVDGLQISLFSVAPEAVSHQFYLWTYLCAHVDEALPPF